MAAIIVPMEEAAADAGVAAAAVEAVEAGAGVEEAGARIKVVHEGEPVLTSSAMRDVLQWLRCSPPP